MFAIHLNPVSVDTYPSTCCVVPFCVAPVLGVSSPKSIQKSEELFGVVAYTNPNLYLNLILNITGPHIKKKAMVLISIKITAISHER